jgi:uncharacterized protein (DUF58 family)
MRSWIPSAFRSRASDSTDTNTLTRVSRARSLFFNSIWLWGAVFLILLGMILRERAPTLLGLLTLVTAGGAWVWARYALDDVIVTRTLDTDRLFPGEQVALRISVVNRKLLPVAWLEIEDQLPDLLRIVEQENVPSGLPGRDVLHITTAMRWYERVSWTFHVECPARGYYLFGPTELRSGDLFGFFTAHRSLQDFVPILVYPRIVSLDHIGIPPQHLFGDQRQQRMIITDPTRTVGVRDYRPEDTFRHIHWNATARAQKLQTKVYEPSTSVQFGVFLNLDTFEHYWEGIDYERAENAITVAASVAVRAVEARHTVGMYANGVIGGSDQPLRVRPSRNLSQAGEILSGLARLSPIASINFPKLLRAETNRFPLGSTVVVVTALMTDALAAAMADLKRVGHRLVLVGIDEVTTPPIRGLLVHRVDSDSIHAPKPSRRHYAVQMNPGTMTAVADRVR